VALAGYTLCWPKAIVSLGTHKPTPRRYRSRSSDGCVDVPPEVSAASASIGASDIQDNQIVSAIHPHKQRTQEKSAVSAGASGIGKKATRQGKRAPSRRPELLTQGISKGPY
jgi:hypothetical protein